MIKIKNARPDGKIGNDIYIAYSLDDSGNVVYAWIGSRQCGPMLQYAEDGNYKWDGATHRDLPDGAWTPIYSRGDYGRNYACGGHWSGHTNNLIGVARKPDTITELIVLGNQVVTLPAGINGDITQREIDCTGSWAIFFESARETLDQMLSVAEIAGVFLPQKTKNHLAINYTSEVHEALREVIEAYKI